MSRAPSASFKDPVRSIASTTGAAKRSIHAGEFRRNCRSDERHAIEEPDYAGRDECHLIRKPERRVLRLRQNCADTAPARFCFDSDIGDAAEAREHFEFQELGVVQSQCLGGVTQRRAWVLPPTRLTLVPTSTAGFWPSWNSRLRTIWPSVMEIRLVGM